MKTDENAIRFCEPQSEPDKNLSNQDNFGRVENLVPVQSLVQINSVSQSEQALQSAIDAGEGTQLRFKCEFPGCDKEFIRKVRLNAHMHLHYGT